MITIDSREALSNPNNVVTLRTITEVSTAQMDFADYMFEGYESEELGRRVRVGVELSTISDVCGKITSGRLGFQLSNLLTQYDVAILLIEQPASPSSDGSIYISPSVRSGLQFDRFMEVLQGAQAHGVIVTYAQNRKAAPYRIASLYNYWNKPPELHSTFRQSPLVHRKATMTLSPELDARATTLMTLPGIGENKARALLEQWGSLRNIFNLGTAGFTVVDGIGKATANTLIEYIEAEHFRPAISIFPQDLPNG